MKSQVQYSERQARCRRVPGGCGIQRYAFETFVATIVFPGVLGPSCEQALDTKGNRHQIW
jgi:hypothetical protein